MNSHVRDDHNARLAVAFDGQAAQFEKAPVQTDPAALRSLVMAADFAADSRICDVGCGPGLVSLALLEAGHRVVGIDLSAEMIGRAWARCGSFGDRARFEQRSIGAEPSVATFDGAISRYVLHHVIDPVDFMANQVRLIRPGGVLILSDHTTDVRPGRADEHRLIETLRDRSHTRNQSLGGIVDLFGNLGLESIRAVEESFTLDFDEWFDRGTPIASKGEVHARLIAMRPARGFRVEPQADGRLTLHCWRAIVRGVVPGPA